MIFLYITLGIMIYSFIAGLTYKLTYHLSTWHYDSDIVFAIFWVITLPTYGFVVLGKYLGTKIYYTLFRMIHPDNFIFEISSDNFAEIAKTCTIVKGEISEECVLAWSGNTLSLMPINSDLYQEQIALKQVVEGGYVRKYEIGKLYKDKDGRVVGYYSGQQVVGTFKETHNQEFIHTGSGYNVGYWKNDYRTVLTFSIVHMFDYYSIEDGPNREYSYITGNYESDGALTHTNYSHYHNGSPKLYECNEEESKKYAETKLFNVHAVDDIETYNLTYMKREDSFIVSPSADEDYFKNMAILKATRRTTMPEHCTLINVINYNKVSDKHLFYRNKKS